MRRQVASREGTVGQASAIGAGLQDDLEWFRALLVERELSPRTVEKYVREVRRLLLYLDRSGGTLSKASLVAYKAWLVGAFAPSTVNVAIAAINGYLANAGMEGLCLRRLRVQSDRFRRPEQELTRRDYRRLLHAARQARDRRALLLLQTLCSTGIRVSELRFVTVAAAKSHVATVENKGKVRSVWIPPSLCEQLLAYACDAGVQRGPVLRTSAGRPLDRTCVWRTMKRLAHLAGVGESKVYPHNLRHLFALSYYEAYHDIDALSEILGHSRVETTRVYVATTGLERERQISSLGLLV